MLALALFVAARAFADEKPTPLACVERYLGAKATVKEGRLYVQLTDGTLLAYDTGKKPVAERIEHPDVKDIFSLRYRTGPIKPITDENEDPGRVRVDALYAAAYPPAQLRRGTFMGHKVELSDKALAALGRVEKRLAALRDRSVAKFWQRLGGTLNDRTIAGTDRKSAHAWGLAIDLDPSLSNYWRWEKGGWKNRLPQALVDAFEAEGFIWGGRWYHFDTMHFEYRPEILDGNCYD